MGLALVGLFGLGITGVCASGPTCDAMLVTPIAGLVALAISALCAHIARRRIAAVDVLRMMCWTVFGCGTGLGMATGGQNAFVYPQETAFPAALADAAVIVGLVVIAASIILLPTTQLRQPGCCETCGYQLCGLLEDRCPECGSAIDTVGRRNRT